VERIVVASGRALGVVAADGTAFRARRAVLADVSAPSLYEDLIAPGLLPPRLMEDLTRFDWDLPDRSR
jgi:hypothetical protein